MSLLLWPLGAYLGLCALVYVLQDRLTYFPTRELAATPMNANLAFDDVWLQTPARPEKDGYRIHGWWVPHPEARATVVFFHGNAGNAGDRVSTLQVLHALRLETLIVDYPGYGRSEGRPSDGTLAASADAAWARARELSTTGRLVAWGRSLGGGVAAELVARTDDAAGLVLESTFTSVPELAQEAYWFLPAKWLARSRLSARAALRSVRCPVLVAHGAGDRVVPVRHGRRLFEAAAEPKRFLALEGGHDDGFVATGADYARAVSAFLDELVCR